MLSYAVVWQEPDRDRVYSGRAEFDSHGLALHGQSRDDHARRYIPDTEFSQLTRDSRIGPYQALRLTTRDGRVLLVAALLGVGVLAEIYEKIAARIARQA